MKLMKKFMKKSEGFTLVELIVVIAILAILAGVAVPAYTAYIAKANDSAITSELSAIQTAAQAACALEGASVASITITNAGSVTVVSSLDDDDETTDISEFYTVNATYLVGLIEKHSDFNSAAEDTAAFTTWTAANGWSIID